VAAAAGAELPDAPTSLLSTSRHVAHAPQTLYTSASVDFLEAVYVPATGGVILLLQVSST